MAPKKKGYISANTVEEVSLFIVLWHFNWELLINLFSAILEHFAQLESTEVS